MHRPVTMEALAERLAMMGFVIAPHGDHIGLRLSFWTSVRVHVRDGKLSCDAHFGPFRRTHATIIKTLGLTVVALTVLLQGAPAPVGMAVVLLALALWSYDALRYTLTETCITQVRQAYLSLLEAAEAEARTPQALAEGEILFTEINLRERAKAQ